MTATMANRRTTSARMNFRIVLAACLCTMCAGPVLGDTFHRSLTTEEQQRLQRQAVILLEPDQQIGLQERTNAADALVRMRSLESTAALNDALRSGRVEPIL
ncbi:MAG TPA: hypothetical protein DEO57_08850, partial [Phycisphaerales bacterium]|nr:hypothetical protein [Phycisphaerales bacterium]